MTEQNRDQAVNPEPKAVISDLQPQPQQLTAEEAEAIRGGSIVTNLANLQHETAKGIVQNLRA